MNEGWTVIIKIKVSSSLWSLVSMILSSYTFLSYTMTSPLSLHISPSKLTESLPFPGWFLSSGKQYRRGDPLCLLSSRPT